MRPKTIGVGQCRVCKRGLSLLKSHICPDCWVKEQWRKAEEQGR